MGGGRLTLTADIHSTDGGGAIDTPMTLTAVNDGGVLSYSVYDGGNDNFQTTASFSRDDLTDRFWPLQAALTGRSTVNYGSSGANALVFDGDTLTVTMARGTTYKEHLNCGLSAE